MNAVVFMQNRIARMNTVIRKEIRNIINSVKKSEAYALDYEKLSSTILESCRKIQGAVEIISQLSTARRMSYSKKKKEL
jgi:hypothetical protein